jgi:hypothetical protein
VNRSEPARQDSTKHRLLTSARASRSGNPRCPPIQTMGDGREFVSNAVSGSGLPPGIVGAGVPGVVRLDSASAAIITSSPRLRS